MPERRVPGPIDTSPSPLYLSRTRLTRSTRVSSPLSGAGLTP